MYPALQNLIAEEFAFLVERTASHPTLLSRLQALEHLRAAGIPVPVRAVTTEVLDAFKQFELITSQNRQIH